MNQIDKVLNEALTTIPRQIRSNKSLLYAFYLVILGIIFLTIYIFWGDKLGLKKKEM